MIGGEPATVSYLAPVFSALAPGTGTVSRTPGRNRPGDASHSAHASSLSGEHDNAAVNTAEQGYLHCGPHGAGHFVKMIHNGIEYGMMAAYAEGFNILHNANIGKQSHEVDAETTPLQDPQFYQYEFNLPDIAEVWRRGSVISSWLLDLTAGALNNDPALAGYEGRVSDSGEGRWTLRAALDEAVPVPVLSAALYARFSSRGQADFANKVLSAMRHQFGGHAEKSTQKPGD
jgi:6-phosphogluconate dehydrogenase